MGSWSAFFRSGRSLAFTLKSFSRGFKCFSRVFGAAGGAFILGALASCPAPAQCLRQGAMFLDPDEDLQLEVSPMEMNEAAALTHTSLLKQASGVAVDGTIQLLHRTLRATLDFSTQYRRQLQEVIELLEYCTTMLRHPQEHDRLYDLLVAARAKMDSLKQQLKDLDLLMTYACSAVENTAMAAYISGGEFSASAARQITDSAKLELGTNARQTEALEMQYTHTHTRYIEAAQKMMDEAAAADTDDGGEEMMKEGDDDDGVKDKEDDEGDNDDR